MSESIEKHELPPGKLIDMGGYKLHINCMGAVSPTVILEAGLGSPQLVWDEVRSEIAKFTRVCSYDRSGLGWSEHGLQPRTSQQAIKELHILLEKAGVSGPYVLVGHSFGGYHVRLFASTYPDEVVGMVLVDANHHDQESRLRPNTPAEAERASRNREGVRVPEDFFESARQVRQAPPLRDMPLVVLGATLDRVEGWVELQKDLPNIVANGKFILVEECGHFIQFDRPELVIESIREVVEEARNKGK